MNTAANPNSCAPGCSGPRAPLRAPRCRANAGSFSRRAVRVFRLFVPLLFLWVLAIPAFEGRAACPDQAGTLFMPSPAGSQPDMLYQPLLAAWNKSGFPLSPTPRPGRGGSYALSGLLWKEPSSCALAVLQLPSFLLLSRTRDRMVSENDVVPVAVFAYVPHALWVAADSPFNSVGDLRAFARELAGKRESLVIAGVGSYTDQHLANLAFARAAGIQSQYYPVLGSAEAIALVKSKKAHACWGYALPEESMPGMRPLAVSAASRSPALSRTPTFREQETDLASGSHFGLSMARNVPEDTLRAVAERVVLLLADPALRRRYTGLGASPLSLAYDDMPGFMALREKEVDAFLEQYPLIPRAQQ